MKIVNRLLAALLALALAAAGVILIIELIAQRLNSKPVVVDWTAIYRWGHRTSWDSSAVRYGCIALIVIGALLLLTELTPRKPSRLPMRSSNPATDVGLTRRSAATTMQSAVRGVDGVSTATVAMKRRTVKINATAAGHDDALPARLRQPVNEAAQSRLDALHLQRQPALSVRVATRSR